MVLDLDVKFAAVLHGALAGLVLILLRIAGWKGFEVDPGAG
jgi:hypothetical protein